MHETEGIVRKAVDRHEAGRAEERRTHITIFVAYRTTYTMQPRPFSNMRARIACKGSQPAFCSLFSNAIHWLSKSGVACVSNSVIQYLHGSGCSKPASRYVGVLPRLSLSSNLLPLVVRLFLSGSRKQKRKAHMAKRSAFWTPAQLPKVTATIRSTFYMW